MKKKVKHVSLTRFSFEAFAGVVLIFVVYATVAVVLTSAITWIRDIVELIKQFR